MKDIAAQAGVTTTTVSLALRNHPGISVATRTRIQELAQRLGYQTNPYLSVLMQARRRGRLPGGHPPIALVSALESADAWRKCPPTTSQMREGAMSRVEMYGFRAEEFWLYQNGMSSRRFSDILLARGIRAILFGPFRVGSPVPELAWEHFSVVSLGGQIGDLPLPLVSNDHYGASLQILRECHRLGYRRPGIVLPRGMRERLQGRWEAGLKMGHFLLPDITLVPPLTIGPWKDSVTPFERWLKRAKPDVVVTWNGREILEHLRTSGRRVPEDIGLVVPNCTSLDDPRSGIWQNGRLVGEKAIDLLITMMGAGERGLPRQPVTQLIGGLWNPGRTLRAQG